MTVARLSTDEITQARAIDVGSIARVRGLNLKRQGRELVGPCPRCGGTDRFSINGTKQLFNCRGCGGKGHGAIALVMFIDSVSFREAVETLSGRRSAPHQQEAPRRAPIAATITANEARRQQRDKARWLWDQRQPIAGTIAETYLRKVRGIICPLPPTLGFLPARKPGHQPAMIAVFGLCDEPEPGVLAAPHRVEAVHLTLLRGDGNKADVEKPKIVVGSPGSKPIILAPPNDLLGLAITEGIEDALSVYAATRLGAWAAGAAVFMPKLAASIPDYINCVTVYAHDDAAGQRGSRELADKIKERRTEVTIEGIEGLAP